MLPAFISTLILIGIAPTISNTSYDNVAPINSIFISPTLSEAINSTYNFKFSDSELFISRIDSASNIDKEVASLNQSWWIGLTYNRSSKKIDVVEDYALRLQTKYSEPKTPQELFLKVLSGTFLIRIAAIKGDKSLALKAFLRILSDLKVILKEPTKNQEYMLLAGVYHYAVGGIKQYFYWLKPFFIFLPSPNIKAGKIYLTECTKSQNIIINTEAQYFLYKIENEIYKSKLSAKKHIDWLVSKYPDNVVYSLDQIRLKKDLKENILQQKIVIADKIQKSHLSRLQQEHFLLLLNDICK